MKKTLTLTKDTAPLLVQRIQQMMHRSGKVVMHHIYPGKQQVKGWAESIGLNKHLWIIAHSMPSVIRQNEMLIEVDNDADMQLVRINWDKDKYPGYMYGCGACIKYGTRIHISSERIVYNEQSPIGDDMKTIITKQ